MINKSENTHTRPDREKWAVEILKKESNDGYFRMPVIMY
jgi:hypothetical protein